MTIQSYLDRFTSVTRLTLVGPMELNGGLIEEPCVFVDGGARHRNIDGGVCVGDGDSTSQTMDVKLEPEKDFSDLAYVLSRIPQQIAEIDLLGFQGGRKDHDLINLGEVHCFLKSRPETGIARFDRNVTGFAQGRWEFHSSSEFSVITVEACAITLNGDCKYPVPQPVVFQPFSSLGLSNLGNGTILITCDGPAFVIHSEQSQVT